MMFLVFLGESRFFEQVSGETIRATLQRMGLIWAERSIGSPARTRSIVVKKRRDRLIELVQEHPDWVLGFEDET